MNIVISHTDADGILAVVMLLKIKSIEKVYFTSPAKIMKTIGNSIYTDDIQNDLYIFDISGTKKTIAASSVFDNALWIDHHEWNENLTNVKNFDNVQAVVSSDAKSATKVVADHFGISSNLVTYADEIDINEIKSLEGERILNITESFRATRNYYKMLEFARKLAIDENEIYNLFYDKLIEERKILTEKAINFAKDIVVFEKIKDLNVGIIETDESLPVSKISDNIECDILVAVMHQNGNTKIEFRSNTEDAFLIAKEFGGGGHKGASGATLKGNVSGKDILKKISSLLTN
ncbi:MAG: DHHA1 domain-containing protein [Candidatus Altarchaeum sp.]|nr:DHHA1 domain-containing protein [Candidatus Altarchaeum sp.]